MKYLKNFNEHNNYDTFIVGAEFSNIQHSKKSSVSFCKIEKHVHYNPYIPPSPKFLDILYSDINGNLSFTSEVLPVSEGKTPIGLCIASEEFFGTNEKARWMSLKYMNYTTPEVGSLNGQSMSFGNMYTNITTIDNINTTYIGGPNYGYLIVDYKDNSSESNKLPSVLAEDNTWNISVLGAVNIYAMTDIDGKNKTNKVVATATAQSTWNTDTSIDNQSGANYAPAACCCARYHTLGTQAGDWYLGASGEMSMILTKKTDINIKLSAIHAIYSNYCINSLTNNFYCTSTEYNSNDIYLVNTSNGVIYNRGKNSNNYVIALLQY